MASFLLSTPLGKVTLDHQGTVISVSGETLPVTWWNEAVSEGLYGVHGHIFNPSDCDICDVYNAAIMAVGSENVNTSQAVLAIAMLQTRNIPQDAIP